MIEKKIIVIADTQKQEVLETIREIRPWLENTVRIEAWYQSIKEIDTSIVSSADYGIIFSGDGFILSAARLLAKYGIPIIGVNFGKLGFLAELNVEELENYIPRILRGECKISPRMMIDCDVYRNGEKVYSSPALNDAVIRCNFASRMLYISVVIDDEVVTNYGGDGIIVSTPVGSTAYSLSAGGPLVAPDMRAFVITPICPHILTLRPLVIPSYHNIRIRLLPPYPGEISLTIDGQVCFPMEKEDELFISQAKEQFHLVQTGNRSFFKILQEKFAWGETKIKSFRKDQI